MNILKVTTILMFFLLGWFMNTLIIDMGITPLSPVKYNEINLVEESPLKAIFDSPEKDSPGDWIKGNQIKVYKDKVILDIPDAVVAEFAGSNSMDPHIDETTNGVEIVPKTPNDISVGDIVAYRSKFADGTIIHRVIEKGRDEDGFYYIMKGDNNNEKDPGKIRFDQIERVLVAIIY